MDPRLSAAPVVLTFAEAVAPIAGVVGFYVGGSLASGDFRPGVSDLDLVAVVEAALGEGQQQRLRWLHETTRREEPSAAKLHCVYVARDEVDDVERQHLTWAHGELYPRALRGIARGELLEFGITVLGPPPDAFLPAVDRVGLRAAARAELAGVLGRGGRETAAMAR